MTISDQLTGQLIAIRLLIGVFEAGFYPSVLFYLSTFYTRFDLATRIGIFYGQYAIAGAFSGAICMSAELSRFALSFDVRMAKLTCPSIRHFPAQGCTSQLAISFHH